MPNPENKPEIHASYLEPTDMPAKVQDDTNTVLVNRSESNVLFVRALHGEQSLVSIAISPENDVHVAFPDGTTIFHPAKKSNAPSPLPLQAETQPEPEKEKPVRLRGRIGIAVRVMDSPTGGKMAVTQFSEHPGRAVWSYSNTLPEKPTKETIWWALAAFDEDVSLLEKTIVGKQEYDITCYLRSWTETIKSGGTKTVEGLRLLAIQPFIPRSRKAQS